MPSEKQPVLTGDKRKIEFAPNDKVSAYPEIYDHFVVHALELEGAWMSDESKLWDFHDEASCQPLLARIKHIYGVEASETDFIWEILHRIHAKNLQQN
jgi:hypothetical protein